MPHPRLPWILPVLVLALLQWTGGARADPLTETSDEESREILELAQVVNDQAVDLASPCDPPKQDLQEAARLLQRAYEMRRPLDPILAAEAKADQATVYAWLARWEEAAASARGALQLWRENGGAPEAVAGGLEILAYPLVELGRFEEADAALQEAMKLHRSTGDGVGLADALNSLAEVRRLQNRYEAAEDLLRQAFGALGEDDPLILVSLWNNLASLHLDRGEYARAESLYRRSLRIRDEPEACARTMATAHLNLAEALRLQGDLEAAGQHYASALRLARQSIDGDNPELIWWLNRMAVYEEDRGDLRRAAALSTEALRIGEAFFSGDNLLVAMARHDLARLWREQGLHEKAKPALRASLETRERILGPDHPDVATTLMELAELHLAMGELDTADELAARAGKILAHSPAYPDLEAEALALRAEISSAGGDVETALEFQTRALRLWEDMRPGAYAGLHGRIRSQHDHRHDYQQAVHWAVRAGRPETAFELSEQRRSRGLLDQVLTSRIDLYKDLPPRLADPLLAERDTLLARRAQLRHEAQVAARSPHPESNEVVRDRSHRLQEIQVRLGAVQRELLGLSPLWRLASDRSLPSLPQIQNRLVPRSGWILSYEVGEAASYLFALPPAPGTLRVYPLETPAAPGGAAGQPLDREALHGVLEAGEVLRTLTTKPAGGELRQDFVNALHTLWRALVPADLWPEVRSASQVILLPDGPLHRLPFETLVVKVGEDDPAWWLDHGPPVRYAPSTSALARLRDVQRSVEVIPQDRYALVTVHRSTPTAVAAGLEGPCGPLPASGPIPGPGREASALLDLFLRYRGEGSVLELEGPEATEPAVRAALRQKRWLHLATHTVLGSDHREACAAFHLAPPEPGSPSSDDGFLELAEIYGLDLSAELAVLSGCATHAGPSYSGEGMMSLARAFLVAGASRVLASAWRLDDASSPVFVSAFFEEVLSALEGGATPDYALATRRAQSHVRQRYEGWDHPYFWGGYLLLGDG